MSFAVIEGNHLGRSCLKALGTCFVQYLHPLSSACVDFRKSKLLEHPEKQNKANQPTDIKVLLCHDRTVEL